MTPLSKQQILAERDRLADKSQWAYTPGESQRACFDGFEEGFDAAIKLMLEREKVLRETLNRYASMKATLKTLDGIEPIVFDKTPAGQALASVPEWSKDE